MVSLLLAALEASLAIVVTVLILLVAYAFSAKFARSIVRGSSEKRKPFACGESIPLPKTGLPDAGMYTAVWRLVFKSLYKSLRDSLHTGILSDWLMWMFIFMVVMIVVSMAVLL
ncbi:MAG: hypothetical protein QW335_04230 [Candidatus Nezhaarchaeales archaeon]